MKTVDDILRVSATSLATGIGDRILDAAATRLGLRLSISDAAVRMTTMIRGDVTRFFLDGEPLIEVLPVAIRHKDNKIHASFHYRLLDPNPTARQYPKP
ncbi:hypothetical protein [Algiphilus aromaticivorans]|uniref:hypothetical protein n=1 Tax=Algiphilus aromaticivorans TaxID=382454 RepID=UPI0005C1E71E|nr:hypothetical protein [Algiphilus aromaticivorans]